MHFQAKAQENGRQNIFRNKQNTKMLPLMFLKVEMLTKR